jgi:hypothetical protein
VCGVVVYPILELLCVCGVVVYPILGPLCFYFVNIFYILITRYTLILRTIAVQ